MKTIIKNILLVSAMALPLASCSDFLDKEPLDKGTEAIVFKTPQQFEQAANALYNTEGWKNYENKANYGNMDRGLDILTEAARHLKAISNGTNLMDISAPAISSCRKLKNTQEIPAALPSL